MVGKILIGALSALAIGGAGLASAPPALASKSSNWPMCGMFSLFSDDQCDAINYCLNSDDPACDQSGNQPSSVPPQRQTPQ